MACLDFGRLDAGDWAARILGHGRDGREPRMTSLDFLPASPWVDGLGYLGAILVFVAFFTKGMLPLRFLSILSNLSFIGYGSRCWTRPGANC